MEGKTALVFGATGLVGNLLLEEFAKTNKYSKVKIFVRQKTGIPLPGVEEIVTDFSDPETFSAKIKGDDIYICLGTTIKKAGSVANMEKIDRDLPVTIARMAKNNDVRGIAVVSSIGASAAAKNYYLRIKGEMEAEIQNLGFERSFIVRPSMLLGGRKERRTGEIIGKVIMKTVQPVLAGKLKKFRAIHGGDVAKAMIVLLHGEPGKRIVESDELQQIAKMC
jgi:uncharacterized protein YbjT (DUF2867 family)